MEKIIQRSQQDLEVRVREHLILHTPVAEEGNLVLPCHSRHTTHIGDPVIAAAARASAQAEIDPHMLCFCCCDLSDMELVRLTCCRQTIHRQCVFAYLCINSQCAYCKVNLEHASVLELPTIDRFDLILPSTTATTHQQTARYPQVSILEIWNSHVEPVSLTLAKLANVFWHGISDRCHIHTHTHHNTHITMR